MSRAYRRFVILSSPRCGTHMLRSALVPHPALVAFTEVFNPDFLFDDPFDENTPEETILEQHIFTDQPPGIGAVGFALHRTGARFGRWPTLWQRLEQDHDLHVISLSRVQLLGRYVSYRIMREKPIPGETLVITPEELKADFRIQETVVSAFDERFARHPMLQLKYEQLVEGWDEQMRRIQDFLGVEHLPLVPETKPNRGLPYREVIANYDELAEHFRGTPWGWLFVGHPARTSPGKD